MDLKCLRLVNMSRKKASPPQQQTPYFDEEGVFHPRILSSDARKAVLLSPLSPRMMIFLTRFESSCTLDCCGFSALAFRPPVEWDKRWNFQFETMKAIQLEIEKAQSLEAEVIRVHELRHDFYKADWLMLLNFFAANMEKSRQWK
ncbi:hypothetical protein IAD21_01616 [Abditibacteriota bacterium]|nr:hypothetical protein IAD21_01616 [Abditibacteriota bacterium]